MINANVTDIGGNQYEVEIDGTMVKFDIDGMSFSDKANANDEAFTRNEFIESDDNPEHAEALMDYLFIES